MCVLTICQVLKHNSGHNFKVCPHTLGSLQGRMNKEVSHRVKPILVSTMKGMQDALGGWRGMSNQGTTKSLQEKRMPKLWQDDDGYETVKGTNEE